MEKINHEKFLFSFLGLCFVSMLICVGNVWSATLYVSPSGDDVSGFGSSAKPWASLSRAFSSMLPGDTLIIKDGVYTGDANRITYLNYPPRGSSGAWTVIKAEHDGAAVFDGQNTRDMFNLDLSQTADQYWRFEGIIWANAYSASNVLLTYSRFVKFLRCGAYDNANGKAANFYLGRNCEYILLENCFAYGSGRYKFQCYQSKYIIFRQCVGRFDYINNGNENVAIFSVYSSDDVEVQNCIAIDSDQSQAWSNYYYLSGAFFVPSTNMAANRINFSRCISLNNKLGGMNTTDSANDVTFRDCVVWDTTNAHTNEWAINLLRGQRTSIINCTFGNAEYGYPAFRSYDVNEPQHNDTTIKNSVIYNYRGTGGAEVFSDVETYDYNNYYNNTNGPALHSHDKTVNPIWDSLNNSNGALKYICRVEDGSTLAGQGEGGVDIGANVLTLLGVSGTLWGESGYNVDTGVSMWPFPYEDLIRTNMRSYSEAGVSGNRGFCVDNQNLTKYIWEYLGNAMPQEFVVASNSHISSTEGASSVTTTAGGVGGGGGGGGGGCFIATAAFGSSLATEVQCLSRFRDEILMTVPPGVAMVRFYYDISPTIARIISRSSLARLSVRCLLYPVVLSLQCCGMK